MSVKESYQKLDKLLQDFFIEVNPVYYPQRLKHEIERANALLANELQTSDSERRAISSEAHRLLTHWNIPTTSAYPHLSKLAKEFEQKLSSMSIQEAADHFFQSDQKISLIKHIRTLTSLGLWEAKMMAEGIWTQKEKEKNDKMQGHCIAVDVVYINQFRESFCLLYSIRISNPNY